MDELVTDFTALLQAQLTAKVEAYQRLEPPKALRVLVLEGDAGEEGEYARDLNKLAGGTAFTRMHLAIWAEIEWDEKPATATALDDCVETIKDTIKANKDITADDGDHAAVGRYDGAQPFMVSYPGHPTTVVKARKISASWRVPN
jgi:hypothetical protein